MRLKDWVVRSKLSWRLSRNTSHPARRWKSLWWSLIRRITWNTGQVMKKNDYLIDLEYAFNSMRFCDIRVQHGQLRRTIHPPVLFPRKVQPDRFIILSYLWFNNNITDPSRWSSRNNQHSLLASKEAFIPSGLLSSTNKTLVSRGARRMGSRRIIEWSARRPGWERTSISAI